MPSPMMRRVVDVDRGLFLLRYASSEESVAPPRVMVAPDLGFADQIRFILHPDQEEAYLGHPESCLVVRADSRGKLVFDILPAHEGGSVSATVNIEPLLQDDPARRPAVRPPVRGDIRLDGLVLRGHVAHRGDVAVEPGRWLAGPASPARIEGLRFDWPGKPRDLTIRYAIRTANTPPGSSALVDLGTFAGSRGKAVPVVGLELVMAGPAAAGLRFAAEMMFLGCPPVRATGARITGSGPSGREPLVGLRVELERGEAETRRPTPAPRVRTFGAASSR